MTGKRLYRLVLLVLLAAVVASAAAGLTSSNTVPATYKLEQVSATGVNEKKPVECAALLLETIVTGVAGGSDDELILGGAGAETITGSSGSDCLVGGGGNDDLDGGSGTDVCIGGPGTDTFDVKCETQIQ